jgi:hypothetical protein
MPPLDAKKKAQLEGEYRDFKDSLTQFDIVSKRINELAAQIRIGITPKNQPSLKDPPEAMGLYSDVNQRFAELCPEPAKSCVHSYAKYQACKSGNLSMECGNHRQLCTGWKSFRKAYGKHSPKLKKR